MWWRIGRRFRSPRTRSGFHGLGWRIRPWWFRCAFLREHWQGHGREPADGGFGPRGPDDARAVGERDFVMATTFLGRIPSFRAKKVAFRRNSPLWLELGLTTSIRVSGARWAWSALAAVFHCRVSSDAAPAWRPRPSRASGRPIPRHPAGVDPPRTPSGSAFREGSCRIRTSP